MKLGVVVVDGSAVTALVGGGPASMVLVQVSVAMAGFRSKTTLASAS